ncbi:hypothetical protein QBC43DRAFT_348935 [Cladorrhinum sp. PSN259]|nr:hypothetical protein QBC43DRAFT_348935 [Cladorrhinum sp. PSN259]
MASQTLLISLLGAAPILLLAVGAYLIRLNQLLLGTPDEIKKISPSSSRWTEQMLLETYKKLQKDPITTKSYATQIPPKLNRRYIVTGGSGLVGGYIVLQLLERGQPPESIRIVDFRRPSRKDLLFDPVAAQVDFVQADISSAESTTKAFQKPWRHPSVASPPLTVFHTAAVIVPSDRSKLVYGFCEAINVRGTQNVVEAARQASADILISTTSGSISIRPVGIWMAPWRMLRPRSSSSWPHNFWQVLDEKDFLEHLRKHEGYYSNYAASKAAAERIVCAANENNFRTGSIRPANGVYGNFSDNTLGATLGSPVTPTWASHTVQSFVHGINVAIAHLQFEAVLASSCSSSPDDLTSSMPPQAGRPFVVTDPNPPIAYSDLYRAVGTLSSTPFRTVPLNPILMVLLSYPTEWYSLLLARYPFLRKVLPNLHGDLKHLKPGVFSICTHLIASNDTAGRPVSDGGLGYTGVLTTLQGMVQEILEWNLEHADAKGIKSYQTSISAGDEMTKLAAAANMVTDG